MFLIKVPGGALELDKPVKLFDMKKFQHSSNKCAAPLRARLLHRAFVTNSRCSNSGALRAVTHPSLSFFAYTPI